MRTHPSHLFLFSFLTAGPTRTWKRHRSRPICIVIPCSVWNTTTGCGVDRIANTFCHNLFLIESKTIGSHSTFAHHLVNSVRGEPGVTLSLTFIVITVVIIEVTKYWATGGRATQEYNVTIFFFRFEYVHHGLVDRTWITDFHTIQ